MFKALLVILFALTCVSDFLVAAEPPTPTNAPDPAMTNAPAGQTEDADRDLAKHKKKKKHHKKKHRHHK